MAGEIGLKDVRNCEMTKGEIKRAIKSHSLKMRREEVLASRKVGTRTEFG